MTTDSPYQGAAHAPAVGAPREAGLPHHRLVRPRRSRGRARDDAGRSSSWASSSASTAPGCATGTCSTASPPPSPCWPPPPSAPAGSSWAPRSSRWAGRTRCGWPRTSRPSTSCPGGRLNPGVSVGPPMHYDDVRDALYPDTADVEDFSYERVSAAAAASSRASRPARSAAPSGSRCSPTASQPHSPGLRGRMWYGGGEPAVGAVGRGARHELPDQQRRAGRGVGGLRRDPALAPARRSARTTRTATRPACRRASW